MGNDGKGAAVADEDSRAVVSDLYSGVLESDVNAEVQAKVESDKT